MPKPVMLVLGACLIVSGSLAPARAATLKITNKMVAKAFQQAFNQGYKGKRLGYESLVLPGKRTGWLFATARKPTLFLNNAAGKSRLTLGLVWNGIDGRPWGFVRILAVMLNGVCRAGGGMTDTRLAENVILRKGQDLEKRKRLGGNGGTFRHTLYRGRVGTCQVIKRYNGARWHTMTITVTRVQ